MTLILPTNRDENWRYANLRPLARAPQTAAPPPEGPLDLRLPPSLAGFERWVFIDGRCSAGLSSASRSSFASVLSAREAGHAFTQMLDDAISSAGVDFSLARLNALQGDEVLHVRLPDHAPRTCIELLFFSTAGAASGTSYPRVQVHAGRGSELHLVEIHAGAGAPDSVSNAAVDLALAHGATVEHVRLQHCAAGASCFDTLDAHVGERANYRLRTVSLGGLTSRSTLFIKLAGRGARCDLFAASIANGTQTQDMFAEIEHVAADTTTREVFRGIATDRGKLAFNGKIIVRDQAHGADSNQSLKTLLTGNDAQAAVRPQLEIYTDKVRAVHGATTGKLDEQMLFYLLSRGVDRQTAAALLQWAFIEDAVSVVSPVELRRRIETMIAAQLNEVSALDGLLVQA